MSQQDVLITTIDVTIATGTDDERYMCPPDADGDEWRLESLLFVPATAVAVGATNYLTLEALNGVGGTSLGSLDTNTGGTAFVLGTPIELLTVEGVAREFTGNTDVLEITKVETASGDPLDGAFIAKWVRLRT